MKSVRLKNPLLIGTINHAAGDVVMVPDHRAAELVRLGFADPQDGSPEVKNPDHNRLADCIDPEPPGGLVFNPIDASAPNVRDNPGLSKAVEIGSPKVRTAKVRTDEVTEGETGVKVQEVTVPSTTANEVAPKGK